MTIKYEPKHVCDFCGKSPESLIVGISGLQGGASASEICADCLKIELLPGSVGPVKHPKAAEYEAIERTQKAEAYLQQGAAQGVNVYGMNYPGNYPGPGSIVDPDPLGQL